MSTDFFDTDPGWPYSRAKTAVIRAAAAVIRESGPRAATLKNIAARAGITEPAIFRHFEGVDGLFDGLFFVFERMFGTIDACFTCPEKGFERFLAGMRGTVGIFSKSKDLAYLVLHAEHVFRGYGSYRKRVAELRAVDQAAVFGALLEARELGEIPADADLKSIGIAFYGVIHLTVHGWIEAAEDKDFDLLAVANERIEGIRKLFAFHRPA